ncbi:MAG: hypothetical protein ABI462_12300 [Ignavibacteria bacterium]
MIKYESIPLDSPAAWKDALDGIRHSFAQTWENCNAMNMTTGCKTFLYVFQKDDVKIICPYAERDFEGYTDIVTPYGFSGFTGNEDCSDFANYWNEFVNEKNYICGYISQNPALLNNSYFTQANYFSDSSLFFLDLTLSLTELFENLDTNRKKQLKDFKKIESSFIYDRKALMDFFIDNYYDFLKRINASAANYFKKETLEYICGLDNIFMAGTGSNNKVEAVYIFAFTPYIGDCLFNVARPEGREHSAALLWRGLKFFRSKKIPLMNLGGGTKDLDNISLSKERFGAFKLPHTGIKQIYNKKIYKELCEEAGVDDIGMENYFPAYRKNSKTKSE